jgi:transcriptional regulator with XRE-family HTH domain
MYFNGFLKKALLHLLILVIIIIEMFNPVNRRVLVMVTLGDRIKFIRTKKNISQQELADILNVNRSAISLYETNRKSPSRENTYKIATALGVSIDYLLGLQTDPSFQTDNIHSETAQLMKRLDNMPSETKQTIINLIDDLLKIHEKSHD